MASKPSKARATHDWGGITARLRAKPDEWMEVIQQGPRSLQTFVRLQRAIALRDPDWAYEACARNTQGNRADLWMMARQKTKEEKRLGTGTNNDRRKTRG